MTETILKDRKEEDHVKEEGRRGDNSEADWKAIKKLYKMRGNLHRVPPR